METGEGVFRQHYQNKWFSQPCVFSAFYEHFMTETVGASGVKISLSFLAFTHV